MATFKCLLFFFFLGLALLPFFLPSNCQAYPLDISKFLQRHRKTLHRLAQIRRRDSWDDSGFGSLGQFADPPPPDPFQDINTDTQFSSHHQSKEQHDGFGEYDFSQDAWLDEPFDRDDDGFGDSFGLPSKSDPFASEWTHTVEHHGNHGQHNKFDGFINKGFNDVVPGKSKADANAPEYAKFKIYKPWEGICERKHHSCWQDNDCHVCGPLYSCVSATCKVVSSSGDAGLTTDDEGRDWFDGGYFVDEPFDFGDERRK